MAPRCRRYCTPVDVDPLGRNSSALNDASGTSCPPAYYEDLAEELVAAFGGVTRSCAHLRRAAGTRAARPSTTRAVIEVMAPTSDRAWWTSLKAKWEHRFSQDVIVIRAHAVLVL